MRNTYTGINRGKNSCKPSGGMLASQYADLKGLTVRTLVENLGNIKRLLILNHKYQLLRLSFEFDHVTNKMSRKISELQELEITID